MFQQAGQHEVANFNVVLVSQRNTTVKLERMLEVTERISTTLLYEERRCAYLTAEVKAMNLARDEWLHSAELTNGMHLTIA